jgi:hypothetical protein
MGGKSERSQAATDVQNTLKGYYKNIEDTNLQAANAWSGYKTPFGYKEMSTETDKIYNIGKNKINQDADSAIQTGQQDTAARMASQGITGGSVLNSQTGNVATGVNKSRFNSLQDLLARKAGTSVDLMGEENKNKFMVNNQNQDQLNRQMQQLFAKFGLLGNAAGQMSSNTQNLSDETFWDDVFSGLNAVSGFVPLLPGGGTK